MRKPTLTFLLLIAACLATATTAEAQLLTAKPCGQFFSTSGPIKLHFALSGSACSEASHSKCEGKALETKAECTANGGDGGTTYTSCTCQSIRAARQCYAEEGCFNMSYFLVQDAEGCFFQ